MHSVIPGKHELYDLNLDPLELNNVINEKRIKAIGLKSVLFKEYLEPKDKEFIIIEDYDNEIEEKLKTLGYIN